MAIWKIHAALPGLNVPFYIEAEEEPTHEQINEVWMRDSQEPLKTPAESLALPLREAYPAYVKVERLKIEKIGPSTSDTREAQLLAALQWILDNPMAHPANIISVARDAVNQ
jgi:hypothetical protein